MARSRYLYLFSLSFCYTQYPVISHDGEVYYSTGFPLCVCLCVSVCVLTITGSGPLGEIRWSAWISKSQSIFYVSFSRADSGLCIYHLFVWSNLNCLLNSEWITIPTQFLSHAEVFSREISLVSRLKCLYSCFSSRFCFLVIFILLVLMMSILFLIALIILPPRYFM